MTTLLLLFFSGEITFVFVSQLGSHSDQQEIEFVSSQFYSFISFFLMLYWLSHFVFEFSFFCDFVFLDVFCFIPSDYVCKLLCVICLLDFCWVLLDLVFCFPLQLWVGSVYILLGISFLCDCNHDFSLYDAFVGRRWWFDCRESHLLSLFLFY